MEYLLRVETVFSFITPLPPPELAKLYRYTETTFEQGGPLGYRKTVVTDSCLHAQSDGLVLPTSSMLQLVQLLKSAGDSVECIADCCRPSKRLEVDEDALSVTRDHSREIAKSIKDFTRGQIEVKDFKATVAAIVLITRLFPRSRILILVPDRTSVRNLRHHLQDELEDEFGTRLRAHLSERFPSVARANIVLISPLASYRYWQKTSDDAMDGSQDYNWDVILLADPIRSLGNVAMEALRKFANLNCRMYSFVRRGTQFSERERVLMTAVSGPLICEVPRAKVGTETLWLDVDFGRLIPCEAALDWKRRAYWNNRRRNEYIAAVARAFAKSDLRRLRKYGVAVQDDVPRVRGGSNPDVIMLVESIEHGRAMQDLLPGWTLHAGYRRSSTERPDEGLGSIVTAARAQRRGVTPDVLVVASGSPAQLNLERAWPSAEGFDDRDVLLVDFKDKSDPTTEAAACQRQQHSLRRGWCIAPRAQGKLQYEIDKLIHR